jgi:stage II sporulation protein D
VSSETISEDDVSPFDEAVHNPEPDTDPETEIERETFDNKTFINVIIGGRETTISLREYLRGVLLGEMPSSFPLEAVKAQAVAARTYVMHHPEAIYCDDPGHCMAYIVPDENYPTVFDEALELTDGEIMVYEGEPILAVFFCTSGGMTENAADVWGGEYPYLIAVDSPDRSDANRYRGTVKVLASEFWKEIKEGYPEIVEDKDPFGAIDRTSSGGVLAVEVSGVSVSGRDVRRMFGLNSTNFTVEAVDGEFVFETLGFGHGVGMSQYGALAMANDGAGYREILEWYYSGAELN